jgi:hypothetical protein
MYFKCSLHIRIRRKCALKHCVNSKCVYISRQQRQEWHLPFINRQITRGEMKDEDRNLHTQKAIMCCLFRFAACHRGQWQNDYLHKNTCFVAITSSTHLARSRHAVRSQGLKYSMTESQINNYRNLWYTAIGIIKLPKANLGWSY